MFRITINTSNPVKVDEVVEAMFNTPEVTLRMKTGQLVAESNDLTAMMRFKKGLGLSPIQEFPCVVFFGID